MQRTIALLIFLFAAAAARSQQSVFVRIYDREGVKIAKGRILTVTDSSLQLQSNTNNPLSIPLDRIGWIKTKHSTGNNIAWGAGVSAVAFAILMMASANDGSFLEWSVGEGAALGFVLGAPAGALLGALSTLFKHSIKFMIDGRPQNLKAFKDVYSSPSTN